MGMSHGYGAVYYVVDSLHENTHNLAGVPRIEYRHVFLQRRELYSCLEDS